MRFALGRYGEIMSFAIKNKVLTISESFKNKFKNVQHANLLEKFQSKSCSIDSKRVVKDLQKNKR